MAPIELTSIRILRRLQAEEAKARDDLDKAWTSLETAETEVDQIGFLTHVQFKLLHAKSLAVACSLAIEILIADGVSAEILG